MRLNKKLFLAMVTRTRKPKFFSLILLLGLLAINGQSGSFQLNDAEWRQRLGEERYKVMRKKETEPAFRGALVNEEREGVYCCAGCASHLFESQDKFSIRGCGWPLFKKPTEPSKILYEEDFRLGFKRYEVLCRNCDCHLGHVFNDGPPPKLLRYTINSIALSFSPKSAIESQQKK